MADPATPRTWSYQVTDAGHAQVGFTGDFSQLASGATQAVSKIGDDMVGAGGIATKAFAVASGIAISAVGVVIGLASTYQTTTDQLAASAGTTAAAAGLIGDAFLATGGQTTFSAQQMMSAYAPVAGQLELTAGHAQSAAEATTFMSAAMDLAEGTGTALDGAVTSLAQVMQSYHITAAGAAAATDLLTNVSHGLAMPVGDVATAVDKLHAKLGPLAPSLSDVGTLLLDVASHGLTGSRALLLVTTGLNTLLGGSKATTTELKTLGLNVFDSSGKFVGMQSVIEQLAPKLAGMTEQQRLLAEKALFGAGASKALDDTIMAGLPGWSAAATAADKVGTAHAAATVATDNLHGSFDKLKSKAEDVATSFGQKLLPAVTTAMNWIVSDGLPALGHFGQFFADNHVIIEAFLAMFVARWVAVKGLGIANEVLQWGGALRTFAMQEGGVQAVMAALGMGGNVGLSGAIRGVSSNLGDFNAVGAKSVAAFEAQAAAAAAAAVATDTAGVSAATATAEQEAYNAQLTYFGLAGTEAAAGAGEATVAMEAEGAAAVTAGEETAAAGAAGSAGMMGMLGPLGLAAGAALLVATHTSEIGTAFNSVFDPAANATARIEAAAAALKKLDDEAATHMLDSLSQDAAGFTAAVAATSTELDGSFLSAMDGMKTNVTTAAGFLGGALSPAVTQFTGTIDAATAGFQKFNPEVRGAIEYSIQHATTIGNLSQAYGVFEQHSNDVRGGLQQLADTTTGALHFAYLQELKDIGTTGDAEATRMMKSLPLYDQLVSTITAEKIAHGENAAAAAAEAKVLAGQLDPAGANASKTIQAMADAAGNSYAVELLLVQNDPQLLGAWNDQQKAAGNLAIGVDGVTQAYWALNAAQIAEGNANAIAGHIGTGGLTHQAGGGFIPPGTWGWTSEEGPELAFGGKTGLSVFNQAQVAASGAQQAPAASSARAAPGHVITLTLAPTYVFNGTPEEMLAQMDQKVAAHNADIVQRLDHVLS